MAREVSNVFMCLMGMGTVFVGLICIVIICWILGVAVRGAQRCRAPASVPAGNSAFTALAVSEESVPYIEVESEEPAIGDLQQLVAAISTAIAEDLGSDVSGISVLSFKKI